MKSSYRECGSLGSKEGDVRDFHHLLWPRHDWSSGAAYLLRNHKYFGMIIPRDTLHHDIHQHIINIPVPPQELCEDAFRRICFAKKRKLISIPSDTPDRRLNFLISLWQFTAPDTAAALSRELEFFKSYCARPASAKPSPCPTLELAPVALTPNLALI